MAVLTKGPNDSLALSEVQAFFDRLYPQAGGFAAERVGTVTYINGDFLSWPTETSLGGVHGIENLAYRAATGGSGQPSGPAGTNIATPGAFINNVGSAIGLTNTRIDIDFSITDYGASEEINIELYIVNPNSLTFTNANIDILNTVTPAMSGTLTARGFGRQTITATPHTGGDFIWRNNTALGIFFRTENVQFTYTIHSVRFSFSTTNPFNKIGDPLRTYNRGGDVVPGNVGADAGYPTTGGIAIDDLGSQTHGADSTHIYSWPGNIRRIQGQSAGISYEPVEGTGPNLVDAEGILTNNTGSAINLTNARIDIGITITSLPPSGVTNPEILVRDLTVNAAVFGATINVTEIGHYVITDTTAFPVTSWANGNRLGISIFEDRENDVPFDYTLDYIRIRFDGNATPFTPLYEAGLVLAGSTGAGIGSVTHGATDIESWPRLPTTGNVLVEGASRGITYHVETSSARLYNATGNTIDLRNARVDMSVTVTDFNIDHADIDFVVRIGIPVTGQPDTAAFLFSSPDVTATPGSPTVLLSDSTSFPTATAAWASGTDPIGDTTSNANLFLRIGAVDFNTPDERPFTYTINYVRIRFNGSNEFILIPLNSEVSPDGETVRLSQLRNVDDGEP